MGRTQAHRLSEHAVTLGRALRPAERAALERQLAALVAWQRSLGAFPRLAAAPDATPYVSLYAGGKLRGCYGSHEGPPGARLARAFLLALTDTRYGGIAPNERVELAADVAYVTRARPLRADQAAAALEPGTHGVALVHDGVATVLLPSVARDRGLDAEGLLEVLAKKAARARSDEGIVWVLDADEASSRGLHARSTPDAAKRWLESLVDASGSVAFEMDPATGALRSEGAMRHGRAAVAIEALSALGSKKARLARVWLARAIERGLAHREDAWPERPDMVLGTLALASRAGVDGPLEELARSIDARACSPWHAAQAASVLGTRTPPALWDACVRGLEGRPFSPYALMAARLRDDAAITERCVRALVDAIRLGAPFLGGAAVTSIPETALTAAAVEALATVRSAEARRAVRAGRAFVLQRQIADVPAALHPRCLGAFCASPIAATFRCDVSAHAALAALA